MRELTQEYLKSRLRYNFATEAEAIKQYRRAKAELHGDFA